LGRIISKYIKVYFLTLTKDFLEKEEEEEAIFDPKKPSAPPSPQLTWSPPPFDWIKINIDAAILDYSILIAYLVTSISLAPLCFNNHSLHNALVIVCKLDCSSLSSSCVTIEVYYKIKYKKISLNVEEVHAKFFLICLTRTCIKQTWIC